MRLGWLSFVAAVLLWGRASSAATDERTAPSELPLVRESDEDVSVFFAPGVELRRPQLRWRWRRFQPDEYYLTGLSAAAVVGLNAAEPAKGRWRGGMLFDDAVRRSLALGSYPKRRRARDVSDVFLAATVSYPLLVDGLLSAYWYYDSPDVAEQLLLIGTEVFAVTIAGQSVVTTLAGRERPYGEHCGSGIEEDSRDCSRSSRHRSFFSGHASASFAGASLICIHRGYLPLSGGGVADGVTCGAGFALATATAALRVVSDMHYASDVIIGAGWGTLVGLGLPWLLHYRHGSRSVHLVPQVGGLGIGGQF